MKKSIAVMLVSLLLFSVYGQEEKKLKTGWKFDGGLPAVSFDTDLGFQFGALVEFSNYGDGSRLPDYFDHIYVEASAFTKGSGIFRVMYESFDLIPNIHTITDLSYLPDQANHFYGFNGYESVFNKDWMTEDAEGYRTRMFYRLKRNQFRFKNDFEGKLAGDHFKWSAGFAFNRFNVSTVNKDKFDIPVDVLGLYEMYNTLGIIGTDESDGGWVNTLKGALVYDSRTYRPNPMNGIWTEVGIELAPGFLGNESGFSRLYFNHRQYFTLIKDDLSFAYRLGYQSTLTGDVPFYYQSQMVTSILTGAYNEGLGGTSSMRGIMKNRIIGDGFVLGNLELRWKPVRFRFLNEPCYIGLNAFYDIGRVIQKISLPVSLEDQFETEFPDESYENFFRPGDEKFHHSAGVSLMLARGQSFVIAVDVGKALNEQDGNIGFAIGLNYLF